MNPDFHFLRPGCFAAVPLLWLLLWWYRRSRARGGAWSRMCDAALLPYVTESGTQRSGRGVGALLGVAAMIAVIALAGPVWERLPVPLFRTESALVIALDLSASMNAADVKPSRLERAKYTVADLLRQRTTGQTALLVFAGQAFVVTPLTSDTQTIAAQLPALDTSIMPVQGSAPAAALELAGKLLQQAGVPAGHVVLITDGGDEDAMARARSTAAGASFRVSVLAVGTRDGAPIADANGGFLKSPHGDIVLSKLDPNALAALATAGKGLYLEAAAGDAELARLHAFVSDDLAAHAQQLEQLSASQWHEVGPWLLLPLLPLAALGFRRGILGLVLAVMLGGALPPNAAAGWWRTPDQAGQAAFRHGDYATAAANFADPAWRAAARYKTGDFSGAATDLAGSESAQAHYNRGNALARQGQFPEAIAAYAAALERAPDDVDARFNKELVEKLLQQQEQKKNKPQQQGQAKDQQKADPNQRSEQQFNGDKGGSSNEQQDNRGASNAGGGAQSQENQHGGDQPSDDANGSGNAARKMQNAKDDKDTPDAATAEATAKRKESEAERAQATEQWLRQVPDDPAGLLRRKFEYQYKQLYGDKPSEVNPW